MADDEGGSKLIHPATPIIILVIVALLLSGLIAAFNRFLLGNPAFNHFFLVFVEFLTGSASFDDVITATGLPILRTLVFVWKVLAFFISIGFLWLSFVSLRKLAEVNRILFAPLKPPADYEMVPTGAPPPTREINPKWLKVLDHISSDNPGDWKLAILEADIMLDEMLDRMGYPGQTIGEKLKMVERSDFNTLDNAWEAHKIRNAIAHEGSDFVLDKREAERVITLFETVFKEFKYI